MDVRASDADGSRPNNDVHYVIESRDPFIVDPLTGRVTLAESADWPMSWAGGRDYQVTVAAVDSGCPALRSTCQLNVTVVPSTGTGTPPVWDLVPVTLMTSVAEDAELGHVIYRCTATNPSGADRLRYDWLNESARGFDVTGQLVPGQSQYLQV